MQSPHVMKRSTLRDALFTGSVASLATTAELGASGALERCDAISPSNTPSQWIRGRRAAFERDASTRHTVIGYGREAGPSERHVPRAPNTFRNSYGAVASSWS